MKCFHLKEKHCIITADKSMRVMLLPCCALEVLSYYITIVTPNRSVRAATPRDSVISGILYILECFSDESL